MELVFSWAGLLAFPAGTIASVLVLGYLYRPQIKSLFNLKSVVVDDPLPSKSVGRSVAVILLTVTQGMLVAALFIPGLIGSPSHPKTTIAEMRTVSTAMESYAVDTGYYPDVRSMQELAYKMEPKYVKKLPRTDGWKRELRYSCWKENAQAAGCDHYVIASSGKDGVWEQTDLRQYQKSTFEGFDGDIAWKNGVLMRYPVSISSH